MADLQTLLSYFLQQLYAGTITFTGSGTFTGGTQTGDGTALLPAYSFTSEPTLGFWRSSANTVTLQGALVTTSNVTVPAAGFISWAGRTVFGSPANGTLNLLTTSGAIGSQLKVDAVPTIASGFGAGAAIAAGSTPLAGSINVGTTPGGAGVINFNGTAFPSAPFCAVSVSNGSVPTIGVTSTTQLTLGSSTNWGNNYIVYWICISSK